MVDRGWHQSELARRAATHMPNRKFGRDNISKYLAGVTLPSPLHLNAMAKALGMPPEELLPTKNGRLLAGNMDETSRLDLRTVDDKTVWLRLNQALPLDVALKIMGLIKTSGSAN